MNYSGDYFEHEKCLCRIGRKCFPGELSVHRLGFGATRLTGEGIWGPPKDKKSALAVLRRAVELNVNFIDTADSYGPHVSEELVAEALYPYHKGLVIATKGAGIDQVPISGHTMQVHFTCVLPWKASQATSS